MSVFVDTGVFYAHHDENAPRNDSASTAMEAVIDGKFGQLLTSDYVYDETVTLALSRFEDPAKARGVGNRILGRGGFPDAVGLLFVGPETFEAGVEVFERYDDQGLSFTDATTVSVVERHDVDHVLAFDDDFDGIVPRLDPATF